MLLLHLLIPFLLDALLPIADKGGNPKGFAYIEFLEADAVANACLLDGSELRNRAIKVPGWEGRGRPVGVWFVVSANAACWMPPSCAPAPSRCLAGCILRVGAYPDRQADGPAFPTPLAALSRWPPSAPTCLA